MHYMGSWYLIAYCAERRALRDFALARIRAIEPLGETIALPDARPSIQEYTKEHFGIMRGEETTDVVLRFSEKVAKWVSEQVWHPQQQITTDSDGDLILRFQISDIR